MKNGVSGDVPGVIGHGERIDDKLGGHAIRDLPANDHPGGQIDDCRQIHPALAGTKIGDIAAQMRRGYRRVKITLQQIGAGSSLRIRDCCPFEWAPIFRNKMFLGHDDSHGI